jgi:hypothetical protein
MKQILFSAVIAFSTIAITSPVHAVGPYFENESPGIGQFTGPNPIWPRPGESLWSSSSPRLQSRESLKKDEIDLRNQKDPDKARAAAPDGIDMPADKNIARR